MLMDLNKEYLKEMGITVMGDVIAILKHAREFHEKVCLYVPSSSESCFALWEILLSKLATWVFFQDRTSGLVGESGEKILASRIADSPKRAKASLEEKQKPADVPKGSNMLHHIL